MKVKTEKELGEALKNKEDTIEITGDLAKTTIKIRATGKVAWAIAFASIGIAVLAAVRMIPKAETPTPATTTDTAVAMGAGLLGGGALAVLGGPATYSAILIAIAAGSVGALTSFREYKEVSRSDTSLVLKRR